MFDDLYRVSCGTRTYRRSSWDRSGANHDFLDLVPGETVTLLEVDGPGKVTHIYWTTINASRFHFRQLVLRAWWDGEATPSVEVPLGDLFCIPHCTPVPVRSLCAVVNPGSSDLRSWGSNLYLPMPFASSARIELTYEAIPGMPADGMAFWYHIELEEYDRPPVAEVGRFHAQWRRENLTVNTGKGAPNVSLWDGVNLDGKENYVALEAEGCGQMVGLHLQVDNVGGGWYGEGDDMVFVDGAPGEQWPPVYHGTGSEEVFGGGACPNQAYSGPYTGFHMVEHPDFAGKSAMYRWYLVDPIRFERSLVWTIEHGHANNYENDYTSVAYWYQTEPHAPFPALPEARARLPRFPESVFKADAARIRCRQTLDQWRKAGADERAMERAQTSWQAGNRALLEGRTEDAVAAFESAERKPRLLRATKIWDRAQHNAFTDLVRFRGQWYCTFREGERHVYGKDGQIRIIASEDGRQWHSVALLAEEGVDLRDPKLSITPQGGLMVLAGGSVYEGEVLRTRQPRVATSTDGQEWRPLRPILSEGEWLWRVTWHRGRAYGVSRDLNRTLRLFASDDGLDYEPLCHLDVPGDPNETTLRFTADGESIALVRREGGSKNAWIGKSTSPYVEWHWHEAGYRVGGPNFIVLPNGDMWAAGRSYVGEPATVLSRFGPETYDPVLVLPSGGDNSYPGMAWHDGTLWLSYYSSHEGKASIYLAEIALP
ncbi:MAG: glycoside hydrolase family 172 protein [Anaerolineae bacterium]